MVLFCFKDMEYFVYVIRSEKNGRFYKGMTSDVEKRLNEHNSGRSFSTKPYIPWKLIFVKVFQDRISAREYEKFLKSGKGRDFIKQMINN